MGSLATPAYHVVITRRRGHSPRYCFTVEFLADSPRHSLLFRLMAGIQIIRISNCRTESVRCALQAAVVPSGGPSMAEYRRGKMGALDLKPLFWTVFQGLSRRSSTKQNNRHNPSSLGQIDGKNSSRSLDREPNFMTESIGLVLRASAGWQELGIFRLE